MCGIWGYVTGEKNRGVSGRLRFVEQAALVGTLRGADSTGAFMVTHKPGDADWCKVVGTGLDWLGSNYTQEKFTTAKAEHYRAVVGHNRSATLGKVNLNNAHPFQEGPITLVHNGTLDWTDDMKVQPEHVSTKKAKVEVDSHLICHNLALHSIEEVIPTLFGAFALVWHDARNDSIYMIRNYQRPLHMMKASCEDTLLFASEPDMLWWLAGRTNFSRSEVYSLDPGVLLEFKPGDTKPVAKRIELGYRSKQWGGYSAYRSNTDTTGAAASGKGRASESSPVPTTGGTTKRGRAMLTLLGFAPNQELEFSVESTVPTNATTCVVNGWAYYQNGANKTEAIQAVIHGIDHRYARQHDRDDWYVRPVAVWQVGTPEKRQSCLVCRLVRVSRGYSAESSAKRQCVGPGGKLISVADWLQRTTGGCVECGRALVVGEAEFIEWVGERENKKAMCPECSDKWRLTIDSNAARSVN